MIAPTDVPDARSDAPDVVDVPADVPDVFDAPVDVPRPDAGRPRDLGPPIDLGPFPDLGPPPAVSLDCPIDAGVPADVPRSPGASTGSTACASAPRYTASTVLRGERPPVGPRLRVPVGGCLPYGVHQAIYYEVIVGPGQTLRASALPSRAVVALQLLSRCDAHACRGLSAPSNGWATPPVAPTSVIWTNPGSAPAPVVVQLSFVEGTALDSTVDVDLTFLDAPDVACAGAPRLTPGATSPEQEFSPAAAAPLCANAVGVGSNAVGAPRPFRVTVPAGQVLTATARSLTTGVSLATSMAAPPDR